MQYFTDCLRIVNTKVPLISLLLFLSANSFDLKAQENSYENVSFLMSEGKYKTALEVINFRLGNVEDECNGKQSCINELKSKLNFEKSVIYKKRKCFEKALNHSKIAFEFAEKMVGVDSVYLYDYFNYGNFIANTLIQLEKRDEAFEFRLSLKNKMTKILEFTKEKSLSNILLDTIEMLEKQCLEINNKQCQSLKREKIILKDKFKNYLFLENK